MFSEYIVLYIYSIKIPGTCFQMAASAYKCLGIIGKLENVWYHIMNNLQL